MNALLTRTLKFSRDALMLSLFVLAGLLGLAIVVIVGVNILEGNSLSATWVVTYASDGSNCPPPPQTQINLDFPRQTITRAFDQPDGNIGATGKVDWGGTLRIGLTYPSSPEITVKGSLKGHYGSGAWERSPTCHGQWSAVDSTPVNRW